MIKEGKVAQSINPTPFFVSTYSYQAKIPNCCFLKYLKKNPKQSKISLFYFTTLAIYGAFK